MERRSIHVSMGDDGILWASNGLKAMRRKRGSVLVTGFPPSLLDEDGMIPVGTVMVSETDVKEDPDVKEKLIDGNTIKVISCQRWGSAWMAKLVLATAEEESVLQILAG